ncbi:MAG: hypothetical protein ABI883_01535 [Chthoniobacterales bacterium]
MITKLSRSLPLFALALALSVQPARADLFNASFLQDNLGIWEQDGVWSTSAYPSNGHTIPDSNGNPIPGPDPTYNVVIGVPSICTLGIFARVQTVNVLAGSTLNLGNGGYLWANTGFGNAGLITLNGPSNFSGLLRASANSNVVAGGEIFMSDSFSNSVTASAGGKVLTIFAGGKIRGAGNINAYHGDDIRTYFQIVNHGLIEATQPVNPLRINLTDDPAFAKSMFNDGTLRAKSQGVLYITAPFGSPREVMNEGGTISAVGNGTVRIAAGVTVSGGTLSTSDNGTIRGNFPNSGGGILKNVTNTGTIVSSTGELIQINGTLTNKGIVKLGGDNGSLLVSGGNAILAANGLVSMTGGNPSIAGGDIPGRILTVAPAATIRAKGEISTNNSNFTNKALAIMNQGLIETISGVNIALDSALGAGISNPGGKFRANGAGSVMRFYGTGTLNNSGGTIAALNGGSVRIANGVSVIGGTFATSGTGAIRGGGAGNGGGLIKNVINKGTIELTGSDLLQANTKLTNKGLIHLVGSGSSLLLVGGDLLIDGAGEVIMTPQDGNPGIAGGDNIGRTLTLGPAAKIRGGGTLSTNNSNFTYKAMNVVNHGLIESTSGLTHLFDSSGLTAVNAGGTYRASNGSTLNFSGLGAVANNNGGVIEALAGSTVLFNSGATFANHAGGTIKLNGGTIDCSVGVDLNGGRLIGNGTFIGPVRNTGGKVAPGFSSGKITINGNYNQGANGILSMEIGGAPTTTNYDRLVVNGTASIGGKLQLTLLNGFAPAPSARFTIVASQSAIDGSFSNVPSGGRLQITNGAGSFVVTYRVINNAALSMNVTLSNFQAAPQSNDTNPPSQESTGEAPENWEDNEAEVESSLTES